MHTERALRMHLQRCGLQHQQRTLGFFISRLLLELDARLVCCCSPPPRSPSAAAPGFAMKAEVEGAKSAHTAAEMVEDLMLMLVVERAAASMNL